MSVCNSRQGKSRLALRIKVIGSMAALGVLYSVVPASAEPYALGPEDKLKVKVFDWRPMAGEEHEWKALTGEFTVGAAGKLSLPLIGEINVAGKPVDKVASEIGERLQTQIGLPNKPEASVEVIEYRPFFIMGLVAKPGRYPYGPGLTVLQAISTAGGRPRVSELGFLGLQRDALTNRGDMRVLEAEQIGLQVRQARIDAELHDAAEITFPEQAQSRARQPPVARAMEEERQLFSSRKSALAAAVDTLVRSKSILQNEIQTLKAKRTSVSDQLDLARKDLKSVNDLASKGLAISARQIAASQNAAQLESNSLDIDLAMLRAQQDISKVDRDIVQLRDKYRNEALVEAADIRLKLAANAAKAETARSLIYNLETEAPEALLSLDRDYSGSAQITITRNVNGQGRTFEASEGDLVQPGDVVQLTRPASRSAAAERAGGVQR